MPSRYARRHTQRFVPYAKLCPQHQRQARIPILAGVRITGPPLVAGGREEVVQTSAIEVDEASAVSPHVGLHPGGSGISDGGFPCVIRLFAYSSQQS